MVLDLVKALLNLEFKEWLEQHLLSFQRDANASVNDLYLEEELVV